MGRQSNLFKQKLKNRRSKKEEASSEATEEATTSTTNDVEIVQNQVEAIPTESMNNPTMAISNDVPFSSQFIEQNNENAVLYQQNTVSFEYSLQIDQTNKMIWTIQNFYNSIFEVIF